MFLGKFHFVSIFIHLFFSWMFRIMQFLSFFTVFIWTKWTTNYQKKIFWQKRLFRFFGNFSFLDKLKDYETFFSFLPFFSTFGSLIFPPFRWFLPFSHFCHFSFLFPDFIKFILCNISLISQKKEGEQKFNRNKKIRSIFVIVKEKKEKNRKVNWFSRLVDILRHDSNEIENPFFLSTSSWRLEFWVPFIFIHFS